MKAEITEIVNRRKKNISNKSLENILKKSLKKDDFILIESGRGSIIRPEFYQGCENGDICYRGVLYKHKHPYGNIAHKKLEDVKVLYKIDLPQEIKK